MGGLPLISSTLPLLRPDDDRTGLVMVSHNNCEHQCSFSRCWDLSVFASFFCFCLSTFVMACQISEPSCNQTMIGPVKLWFRTTIATTPPVLNVFRFCHFFLFLSFFDGVPIFLLVLVLHCQCFQHHQKDFSKGMLLKTFTGQVFCKRSCHLIWALSKYYSCNNADLLVIARRTELIPSFR